MIGWETPQEAKHSIRVICDDEGVIWRNKNLICHTINGESSFYNFYPADYYKAELRGQPVTHKNMREDGTVGSTDWGICQINDRFHIGPNKDFPSVLHVLNHPDLMVRWMIRMMRLGHLDWWYAYQKLVAQGKLEWAMETP